MTATASLEAAPDLRHRLATVQRPTGGATRTPTDPACTAEWHGNDSAYRNHRCRCPEARNDHRLVYKRRREGRHQLRYLPALGTLRRLQALNAMGWSNRAIAEHCELSEGRIKQLRGQRRVPFADFQTIRAVYDQLAMIPGPNLRARLQAQRFGWPAPLAWDDIDDPNETPIVVVKQGRLSDSVDDVKVQRAIAGALPASSLTAAERVAAVERLSNYSAHYIAEQLRITERSVERIRARLRETQAPDEAA